MKTKQKFTRIAYLDDSGLLTFSLIQNTSKEKLNKYQIIVYCFLSSVFEKLNSEQINNLTLCN